MSDPNQPHDLHWTTLSSRHVLKDRWISVRADRCAMPNNHIIDPYYVIENTDFVHVLAITKTNQCIFVKQYRHGVGKVFTEVPGGKMEANDSDPLLACQRELLEETGYGGGEWTHLHTVHPNPAKGNNQLHSFLAVGVEKQAEQTLDLEEDIEIVTYSLDEVTKQVMAQEFSHAINAITVIAGLIKLGRIQAN